MLLAVGAEELERSVSIEDPFDERYGPFGCVEGLAPEPLVEVVDVSDDGGQGKDLGLDAAFASSKEVREKELDTMAQER